MEFFGSLLLKISLKPNSPSTVSTLFTAWHFGNRCYRKGTVGAGSDFMGGGRGHSQSDKNLLDGSAQFKQTATFSLPETLWKPMGKGYQHFPEFFLRYCSRPSATQGNPDLGMSLDAFAGPEAKRIIQTVGTRPCCLIQGITCPHNGTSLHRYLTGVGVNEPMIHAIDIMDVGAVARATGFELANVAFCVGDATRLLAWADNSVQVLVQDHLVNCAPHNSHEAILREAARVLDPRGVFIMNFSVFLPEAGRDAMSWSEAERLLQAPLGGEAYSLKDIVGSSWRLEELKLLLGRVIAEDGIRQILVTDPHGNFEFYSSFTALENLLSRLGLQFVFVSTSQAVDPQGVGCLRYRTLVQHAREK